MPKKPRRIGLRKALGTKVGDHPPKPVKDYTAAMEREKERYQLRKERVEDDEARIERPTQGPGPQSLTGRRARRAWGVRGNVGKRSPFKRSVKAAPREK